MSAFHVYETCCAIVGCEVDEDEFDPEATIFDLCTDEMSIAELIHRLQNTFGKGSISFDDVLSNPVIEAIASRLSTSDPSPLAIAPPPSPPPSLPLVVPGSQQLFVQTFSGAVPVGDTIADVRAKLPDNEGNPPIHRQPDEQKKRLRLARSASRFGTPLGLAPETPLPPTAGAVRPSLSYNENLGVGVVGGCVETAALMPVLTWKFCVQEGRPLPPMPSAAWYRGVGVLAGSVAPLTGIQMFCNGVFEGWLTSGERAVSDGEAVGCALGAGAVSATLYAPVEMTTIHQQKTGLGPAGTIAHLAKTHGVSSLWRGLVPTACREAIYTAGYLGLAPVFCAKLMQQPGWEERFLPAAILGSCAAGVLANAASHPIDTAKTVIQADVAGARYSGGMLATILALGRASGVARLYTGGLARTIRTCGAFFVVSTLRERFIQLKVSREDGFRV